MSSFVLIKSLENSCSGSLKRIVMMVEGFFGIGTCGGRMVFMDQWLQVQGLMLETRRLHS